MNHYGLDVLLYSLLAAESPLTLAATLVVLRSDRPRLNGVAFALGFVGGQAVVYLLVFAFGIVSVGARDHGHDSLQGWIELAFAAALFVTAGYLRRHGVPGPHTVSPRTRRMLDRLAQLGPFEAMGAGALLGALGPKRLFVTVFAAASISASGAGSHAKEVASVVYLALATLAAWLPVLLFVVFGERANRWLVRVRARVNERRESVTVWALVVIGLLFVGDAVLLLA